jgi:hypothetical protein
MMCKILDKGCPSYISAYIHLSAKFFNMQCGHKVFTTLQTYLKHKVQEMLRNSLRCLKEQLRKVYCYLSVSTICPQ